MITANKLIELMYLSMTDPKIIEIIEKMGLEQPTITEEYEEEKAVYADDSLNSGIVFTFKELNGYSSNGEPCLVKIDFTKEDVIAFPYKLTSTDNYIYCCEKLGRNADYRYKRFMKTSKVWVQTLDNKKLFKLIVDFRDTTFSKIKYILVMDFNETELTQKLIPNED